MKNRNVITFWILKWKVWKAKYYHRMCRKVYFCTAFAVHYRALMDGDKLVVHFADKKHKKGKHMSKLANICRVDSHLLWEPLYRKYLFAEIFFPSPAKNVFRNFFMIVISDQRFVAISRIYKNLDSHRQS